jgi:hypothetical protein
VVWTGLVWPRIGTSGERERELLRRTFGFHKMLGGSRVAAQAMGSRLVLSSMKSVN